MITVTFGLDEDTYGDFKAYSDAVGVPMQRVLVEAVEDFRETSLAARMDSMAANIFRDTIVDDLSGIVETALEPQDEQERRLR